MNTTAVQPRPKRSTRLRIVSILERVCATGVVVALMRSSFAHLSNPYAFLDTVYSYRIVPEWAGPWVAGIAPFLQLALAVCLLARWWRRAAYSMCGVLFVLFVAVQGWTLYRGLDISCGCFGTSEGQRIGWQTLAVAGGCAIASVVGLILSPQESPRCDAAPLSP